MTSVVHGGRENLKWLYEFAETSGELLARNILADRYRKFVVLRDEEATRSRFVAEIQGIAAEPSTRAIDVIMMVHGLPGKLCFTDGDAETADLAEELVAVGAAPVLRMFYSTACFGATHAEDLLRAGFDMACGAVGENCNAATEFPTVLTLWGWGYAFKDAIAAGETIITRAPADLAAKLMGFKDANSDKKVFGDGSLTIGEI